MYIANNMQSLKPCPFCGNYFVHVIEARLEGNEDIHTYSVCCDVCQIGIFRPNFGGGELTAYTTAEEAINAWNNRKNKGERKC